MSQATYTLAADGTYEDSDTGIPASFKVGTYPLETAVRYGMPGATAPEAPDPFSAAQIAYLDDQITAIEDEITPVVDDLTATADGSGTGTIAGDGFYTVTSANANHIIVLPSPALGTVVALRNGATGYELRSSAPATVAINGGTGANAESAIPANTLVVCLCDTETTWLCTNTGTDGDVTTTEAAA